LKETSRCWWRERILKEFYLTMSLLFSSLSEIYSDGSWYFSPGGTGLLIILQLHEKHIFDRVWKFHILWMALLGGLSLNLNLIEVKRI
jgi:hypothetical protein